MLYDDEGFRHLQEWMNNLKSDNDSKYKLVLDKLNKDSIGFLEYAFLCGFEAGYSRKNEENWDSWNQK